MKQPLIDLLGADRVLTEPAQLDEFRTDYTEMDPSDPLLAVQPRTVEEVQAIIRLAKEHRTPITPRIAGSNVGGLALAAPGGVIMDLRGMNRIVELNADDMYAVIEPGVTQQQLKDHLIEKDVPLTLGYSLAPPDTSVLANAIMGGLTNRSLKYGAMSDWISGLEVVLPDGEVAKTGAWALEGISPYGRVPFPDVSGLFTGFLGTTGIVTKLAFQLWPRHPLNERLFILTYSAKATFTAMQRLCRTELCDDIGGLSWPSGKMMMGVNRPHPVADEGEPKFFLYVDLTAEIEEEMAVKKAVLKKVINSVREMGEKLEEPISVQKLLKVNPAMGKFADFPTELDFMTDHGGGGLTWIGTYGPLSRFVKAADEASNLMVERGFPPNIVSRPMRGGHFGVLRFVAIFDKEDKEEVARIRELNQVLLEYITAEGFVMYKTPSWAVDILEPKMDPGFLRLVSGVRRMLDPTGIMNPDKLFQAAKKD